RLLRPGLLVALAAVVLPLHRAVGRVRHPAPGRLVARARWLRDGASQRATQLRARPGGVERLRLRLRHGPYADDAPRHRRPARAVHQRRSFPGAILMRVLLSWLHEFAPIGDDVDALADEMSALGLAVEDVIRVGTAVDGVIVARVLEARAHPDADKVHLV